MKRISISILAMATFGAMSIGAHTAAAAINNWTSSGWQPLGTISHLGNFSNDEGFSVGYWVSTGIAPAGVTVSENITGTVNVPGSTLCTGNQCPTTHWAFTECNDGSYLTGGIEYAFSQANGNVPILASSTNDTTGIDAGYWNPGFQKFPTDIGYCPSGKSMIRGGVWMWLY